MSWSSEDGGPERTQWATGGLELGPSSRLGVASRETLVATMCVWGGERLYLLTHTGGEEATLCVEEIDPITLAPVRTTGALEAGPIWPGGMAADADGALHVVVGRHAYRLSSDLDVLAVRELPRHAPYNSFVTLSDGTIATKDFGGARPGRESMSELPAQLVALDPITLDVVDSLDLPEASVARLSARDTVIYVVGVSTLWRVHWVGGRLRLDEGFAARYRDLPGQGYGWDCTLVGEHAWLLDNGEGSHRFDGTLRGKGVASAPLHLTRVDLRTAAVDRVEICGEPGGLVANPPVVDPVRHVAVGYDSGNGVVAGFDDRTLAPLWRRDQDHASHLVLYPATGELVTGDGPDVVVLDVATGRELGRAAGALSMQSVLFPTPGRHRDVYVASFLSLARISVSDDGGEGSARSGATIPSPPILPRRHPR